MSDEFTSPRQIAELNIRHYKQILKTPLDDETRATVERLLASEESKLADLAAPRRRNPIIGAGGEEGHEGG
ncbi:hypothetical protein [uncultured Methylovirgula sp.]|uniref:hypothetical protein n=1 Tax=uncultured Methylovirgula sp. TaxID=1285960 RepID=UPI002610F1B3|nr:hypothetical protein [uncultured Methylovirgula sp.]